MRTQGGGHFCFQALYKLVSGQKPTSHIGVPAAFGSRLCILAAGTCGQKSDGSKELGSFHLLRQLLAFGLARSHCGKLASELEVGSPVILPCGITLV